jgi:hypothetical protein
MGHFKLRFVPGGAALDVGMGVRMKRVAPGEEDGGRARRSFGPQTGCTPAFDAWVYSTDPDPPVLTSAWDILLWPSDATVLCEGDCLEWSVSITDQGGIATGTQPTVTLEAAADCVGLIAHVQGEATPGEDWLLTFTATLDGVPFGTSYAVIYNPGTPTFDRGDFEFGGDYTSSSDCNGTGYTDCAFFPTAQNWSVEVVYAGDLYGATFAWDLLYDPSWFSAVEDTDGLGRPRVTFSFVESGLGYPEDNSQIAQAGVKLDGNDVVPAAYAFVAYPGYP